MRRRGHQKIIQKENIQFSLDALLRKQEIEHERGAQGVPNGV